MNEAKWDSFFEYKKGKGLYFLMIFPYLLMLVMMLPLSIFWFELMNFKYKVLGSISIIFLLTLTGMFKFFKFKERLQNMILEKIYN